MRQMQPSQTIVTQQNCSATSNRAHLHTSMTSRHRLPQNLLRSYRLPIRQHYRFTFFQPTEPKAFWDVQLLHTIWVHVSRLISLSYRVAIAVNRVWNRCCFDFNLFIRVTVMCEKAAKVERANTTAITPTLTTVTI